MALRNKPLETITAADLQGLIDEKTPEDKHLEYKETLPEGREKVVEFLADLSSFANTAGGDLIFGIKEVNREPAELVGFPVGVAGYAMLVGPSLMLESVRAGKPRTIDRDALVISEIMVERLDMPADQILRPAFDAVWNAAGWDRSRNYTPQGHWRGQQ